MVSCNNYNVIKKTYWKFAFRDNFVYTIHFDFTK